jgi:hypothetical protein
MTTARLWSPQSSLAAAMASQSGLFTATQARAAGFATPEIQRLRTDGSIVSVRRGVYAGREAYLGLDELARHAVNVRAVVLRCKTPTTISHESAAVWADLALLRPELDRVHATRPELPASRIEAGVHHHPGALPSAHVTTRDSLRLTSPARTAVDVARTNDFARGLTAVDSALRAGTSPEEILGVLEMCRSWPGARRASRAVTCGDCGAANPGESWSRAILIESGLAPDALRLEVRDAAGLVGFADLAWLERRTLGEFDGRSKYGMGPLASATDALWAEKLREDRLRALGWEIVRWTWADLFDPQRLVERVRAAFRRALLRG